MKTDRWRFAWAWTIGAVLLSGCIIKPKPPGPPEKQCPSTCPAGQECKDPKVGCVPAVAPAQGTPMGPERLARTDGAKLANGEQAVMMVQCCMATTLQAAKGRRVRSADGQWIYLNSDLAASRMPLRRPLRLRIGGREINTRWPLASEEWMDYTHNFGANFFHFRINAWMGDADHESEWADIGGPLLANGEFNEPFWTKATALVFHAYTLNSRIEAAFDTWYCKSAKNGDQPLLLPREDIEACGVRPSPGVERILRRMVFQWGCYGNVVFATDVEGGQVPGEQRAWFEWVHSIYRDEELKSGCGFVHMIGTNTPKYGDGPFDYVATHDRGSLLEPIAGKWTIDNERGGVQVPEEQASNFANARERGLAWALWRGEMSDPDFRRTLELFKAVIDGSPVGCFAPAADDEKWTLRCPSGDLEACGKGKSREGRPSQTLLWLNAAKAVVGDPTILPGATVSARAFLALTKLAEELRKAGHCASGPWADALAVQAPDGYWEELHALGFTDGGYSGDPYKNVWAYPGTEVVACPGVPPPIGYVGCKAFGPQGSFERWDCTPKIAPPPHATPVWPEGPERKACEDQSAGGPPSLSASGLTGTLTFVLANNPWQFKLGGVGTATLHCTVPSRPGVELCGYAVART